MTTTANTDGAGTATDTGTDVNDTTTDDTTTDGTTGAGGASEPNDTATGYDDKDAEIAKWREQARKNEQRAKANAAAAKELETIRAQSMTDQEKAVKAAREEGRAEALREAGKLLAEAEIRVAVGTRVTPKQLAALLEPIDAAKFLDEDGRPDKEAIAKWVDRVAPEPAEPAAGDTPPKPRDLGQGARGQTVPLAGDQLEQHLRQALGVAQ
jgi:hypothetical protein